jgi:hypothetical protein
VIVAVTAIIASIYLYFNFNAKSNLITIVPGNVHWCYQFQTKQIKAKATGRKPEYIDSFALCVANLPIFKAIKDPADVGIALYSDIVIFANDYGWYAAMSVNSESKLTDFVNQKIPKQYVGGIIPNPDCKFVKANNHAIYFAWKHKACVIFVPNDTIENLQKTEAALAEIFADKKRISITENPVLKELNAKDCNVIFYASSKENTISHGVKIEGDKASYYYPQKIQAPVISPLWLFNKAGLKLNNSDIDNYLNKDNSISSSAYVNLTFKTFLQYLKPFSK